MKERDRLEDLEVDDNTENFKMLLFVQLKSGP